MQLQYLDIRIPRILSPHSKKRERRELTVLCSNIGSLALPKTYRPRDQKPVADDVVRRINFVEAGGLMYYGVDNADLTVAPLNT